MGPAEARVDRVGVATDSYFEHVVERFGSDLSGLRIAVDCANGAYSDIAPEAFERLGAEVTAIGADPDGENINDGCGATDLALLQETVRAGGLDLGVAFDGDGDRMLAVDGDGNVVDGDQILAILALHLGVDVVAVTVMTNLGFHRLMEERGIRVVTTAVGDRYVLEALRREHAILGGEQSGHVICLRDHVTGDGLAAAMLLCGAVAGRTLAEAAAVMPRYAQVKENVRVSRREVPGGRARRGGAPQRGAERQRPRARPRLGHGAADPGARRGRDGGSWRRTSVVGSLPSFRGSSASPPRELCRAFRVLWGSFHPGGVGKRGLEMCGIIGYVGPRECKPLLLQGLERLEYRGYDSAGIALREEGGLDYVRARSATCRTSRSRPARTAPPPPMASATRAGRRTAASPRRTPTR